MKGTRLGQFIPPSSFSKNFGQRRQDELGTLISHKERARALGFSPKFRSVFERQSGNLAQVKGELIFNKGFQHLV